MKLETLVYDTVKKVIPTEAAKTAIYANVHDTGYEIFFYSLMPQQGYVQCYTLAETGVLDAAVLDSVFAKLAKTVRADPAYQAGSNNLFTFIIDEEGIHTEVEHPGRDAKMYHVKKAWGEKNLR